MTKADNYFATEDYKNSLKCLKYSVQEYFKNPKLFSRVSFEKSLKLSSIYIDIANTERKLSELKDAQRHLKGSLTLIPSF